MAISNDRASTNKPRDRRCESSLEVAERGASVVERCLTTKLAANAAIFARLDKMIPMVLYRAAGSQQTGDVQPMLNQCWATVKLKSDDL